MSARFLNADRVDAVLWAAIDPSVRFTAPEVGTSRLSAMLRPYPTDVEARAALEQAGGESIREVSR